MGCCNSNPVEEEEETKNMKLGIKLKTFNTERAIEVWQLPPPSPIEFSSNDIEISDCTEISWNSFLNPGIFYIRNMRLWMITFWIPDYIKSRQEFLRQHQIVMTKYKNQNKFNREMLNRKMINSSDYFHDFKMMKSSNSTLIWKTLPIRFKVNTNISDIFDTHKGDLMRCYQISSFDLRNAYKAFTFYTDTLESSIFIQMISHHNVNFQKKHDIDKMMDK